MHVREMKRHSRSPTDLYRGPAQVEAPEHMAGERITGNLRVQGRCCMKQRPMPATPIREEASKIGALRERGQRLREGVSRDRNVGAGARTAWLTVVGCNLTTMWIARR